MFDRDGVDLLVVFYMLDDRYFYNFFSNNFDVNSYVKKVYVVSDLQPNMLDTSAVCFIPYPEDNSGYFNLSKACNVGIEHILKHGKSDFLIKTDIDCFANWEEFKELDKGNATIHRYWQVDKVGEEGTMDNKTIGTVCMHSSDWAIVRYNENMYGYGVDDLYIFQEIKRKGIKAKIVRTPKVFHIKHEKHNRDSINPVNRKHNLGFVS